MSEQWDNEVAELQKAYDEANEAQHRRLVRAMSEALAQFGALGVVGGSLPVSSATLKNENSTLRAIIGDLLEAHETVYKHERWACVEQAAARAYAKLEEIDRNAACATSRQPEENIGSQRTRPAMPDHQPTEAPTTEPRPGSL